MSVTDPIADMLTRLRNANRTMKLSVDMPSSKVKESLAALLVREGYIEKFESIDQDGKPVKQLRLILKFPSDERGDRQRTITGLRRVSKPGLRKYCKSHEIPRVLGGMGIAILSTSRGLLSDREARQQHIGGEVLCYVW